MVSSRFSQNSSSRMMKVVIALLSMMTVTMILSSSCFLAHAFAPTVTTATSTTKKQPKNMNPFDYPKRDTLPMVSSSSSFGRTPLYSTTIKGGGLQLGDPVMLVGPGLLQLVLARHLARAGLRPIVVAQQSKLNSFFENLLKTDPQADVDGINAQIAADSTIGMPELGDPYFGELKGVVFCAEEAVLPVDFVSRVLDFTDNGQSAYGGGEPSRVICALPVSDKVQKEKSNSWIPIFNNDKTMDENWKKFADAYRNHPCYDTDGTGSIVRFGSLFGGSIDGPPELQDLGLDEGMYKVRQKKGS
jgi:hypothetical protein